MGFSKALNCLLLSGWVAMTCLLIALVVVQLVKVVVLLRDRTLANKPQIATIYTHDLPSKHVMT